MWIDQYANKYTGSRWPEIQAFIRSVDPRCVLLANNAHNLRDSDVLSYEYPWSGQLPPVGNTLPAEVCDTIQTGQRWFWTEARRPSDLQPAAQIVRTLRMCGQRNANYLLDVPPDRDGLISGPQLERLREVGALVRSGGDGASQASWEPPGQARGEDRPVVQGRQISADAPFDYRQETLPITAATAERSLSL